MPLSDLPSLQEPLEPASFIESIREFEERVSSIAEVHVVPVDLKQEEDQALESHEVVGLQAFIERKEWIHEKIIFLEALPKVEVFPIVYGADLGEISATRAQLNEWLAEQEKIEKETEMFDSGDLKKLKKLTKAATQRNLSPQDTDLIEVTLATLYALDRLFNLLRNRSELLELLSLRLAWEELRLRALSDQAEIMTDSQAFLKKSARWSPAIYASSGDCSPKVKSDHLSRSVRFSLADSLSKSVTHISSRISTLRHGHITMSAKTLDRLIDESPASIPEWMLDEQDKLEELCGNELTTVAKFLLDVVTQWKRADELYAETMKDKAALEDFLLDIHQESTEDPSRKRYNALKSRLELLARRISNRQDPCSSDFPMPIHTMFPEQGEHNRILVESLTFVLDDTKDAAQRANDQLKEYLASNIKDSKQDENTVGLGRSRLSVSKQNGARSVSGPASLPIPARSLFNSTFSSRQRTTSVSSAFSTHITTGKSDKLSMPRRMSSALSESRRNNNALTRSGHKGTWSRAPRQSINSILGSTTPDIDRHMPKKYVANPDNKLDVALGDVINSLSVDINVEAVVDTWTDKSGKYWIGGDEPKLCFCRILRSQTVMVRVGGGWQELSKFIKNHFADLFRIIPESPERPGMKEQRWLSASTLRRDSEASFTRISPGTPESLPPSLPSFALSTPEGTRASTVHTPSPNASPLTPLQFIRRAGLDQTELSLTLSMNMNKSKPNTPPPPLRTRRSTTNSHSKVIWRP